MSLEAAPQASTGPAAAAANPYLSAGSRLFLGGRQKILGSSALARVREVFFLGGKNEKNYACLLRRHLQAIFFFKPFEAMTSNAARLLCSE